MIEKFHFHELTLKGAYLIKPFYASDERGALIKDYNVDTFRANGIEHELKEVFYTVSHRGVIRAQHFQRVKEQAKEYGHSTKRELSYLVVHSVLHLLGYDHLDEGPQKAQMRAREEEIAALIPRMQRDK